MNLASLPYIYIIYIRVAVPQLVVGVVLPTLNMNAWTIIITGSTVSLYPVFSHVDLVTETVLQSPRACSHTSPTEASDNAKARSTYSILVSVCKGSLYCWEIYCLECDGCLVLILLFVKEWLIYIYIYNYFQQRIYNKLYSRNCILEKLYSRY